MSDDWPAAGTLLATRYRLVTLLETGGMAQIWSAQDELLARPVAVKLPTGPQVAWREARLAARLSHPGIAAVHDYREAIRTDGTVAPFVVMELLSGETVAARLVREPFGWQESARVGAAVADALAAAHASGVVHRDIKPGNVMLTPNGVKILDFGISAAAGEPDDDDTGATFGTPAYVAPERLDGMPAAPPTDVYGLGVLLFEMVTGQPPYPVETWEELEEARTLGPSELPDTLPAAFREIVDRCLEEDPDRRPGADEIRFELTALWLADQPETEDPSPGTLRPTRITADRPTPAALDSTLGTAAPRPRAAAGALESSSAPPGNRQMASAADASGRPSGDRPPAVTADAPRPGDGPRAATPQHPSGERPPAATPPHESWAAPQRESRAHDRDDRGGRSRDTDPHATRPTSPAPRRAAAGLDAPASGRSLPFAHSSAARTQAFSAGRVATPGRVTAPILPRTAPPSQRRRQALVLAALLAVLVVAGSAYAAVNRQSDTRERQQAQPPAGTSHPVATLYSSRIPRTTAPTTSLPIPVTTTPSASASPSASTPGPPKPTVTLTFADAVSRLRTAVQSGASGGQIRGDVATDLLNLIQPLDNPDDTNVNSQVDNIRHKIDDRAGEGSISRTQAAVLRTRVADLARVAGM